MSRRNSKSQLAVERLLDERRQYQEWIEKLAVPGAAGAPSPVVERVRADYQSRLDNVTRQLAQHESELAAALAEAELRRDQAAGQRSARQEALAEAVLRHDVGEYDDEKFSGISAEHTAVLTQLSEEVEAADRDITRFEEILALIARVLPVPVPPAGDAPAPSAPLAAAVPPAPPEPAAPVAPVARVAPPEPATPAAAAAPAEAEAPGKVATRLSQLDELSFLRSVGGVAPRPPVTPAAPAARPAAAEAPKSRGPATRPAPEPATPPPVPRPVVPPRPPRAPQPEPPVDLEPRTGEDSGPARESAPPSEATPEPPVGEAPLPPPVHHTVPETHEARPSARASVKGSLSSAETDEEAARKTLRCTECQTLNLPTEWYCEKCGAELSAF